MSLARWIGDRLADKVLERLEPMLIEWKAELEAMACSPPRHLRSSAESFRHQAAKKKKRRSGFGEHCRVCRSVLHVELHHLVPRRAMGHDVAENLVPLCGAKARGCHARIHNGDPDAWQLLCRHLVSEERAYLKSRGFALKNEVIDYNRLRLLTMVARDDSSEIEPRDQGRVAPSTFGMGEVE